MGDTMASPKPSRIAAALRYLEQMRDRAAEFGGGVADTLADRARDVGGLAYEALTSDPNIGRMTTAEFSQAADRPTPRLDAMGRGAVELGRAVLTEPVETGKAIVQGEIERARGAMESPRAMGQYAGEFVSPLRLAAALRRAPMLELDVYHGTPHRFEPTEANPLGELDASKIGTGEGAQAYGHGIYLAESPGVASAYRNTLSKNTFLSPNGTVINKTKLIDFGFDKADADVMLNALRNHNGDFNAAADAMATHRVSASKFLRSIGNQGASNEGSLYTLDLPDEMIDRMLDWDKPLSEQSEAVRKAFQEIMQSELWDADTRKLIAKVEIPVEQITGKKLYELLASSDALAGKGEFGKAASEELARRGIPGIRYLDAGSRGDTDVRTRNFVVFPGEEKKVKVLRRE